MGILGDLFDFNSDGKMDAFEQAAEFSFIMNMMEEDKKAEENEIDDLELDEILDD